MARQAQVDVTVTKHGEVAVIETSGCENRINTLFCKKWNEALDKVEAWTDVKAVITTGSGEFYSNGLDLEFLASCNDDEIAEFGILFGGLIRRILCFPMVTIAAINGHCFAAAFDVALMHDYRVMHNGVGWMCFNEIDIGVRFPDSMRTLFKMKLSHRAIREAAVFGNKFSAVEAFEYGIIDDIAPEGEAVAKSLQMATSKTKDRRYSRVMLKNMKSDMYGDIISASGLIPGGVGLKALASKLVSSNDGDGHKKCGVKH